MNAPLRTRLAVLLVALSCAAGAVRGQGADVTDRPIADVRIEGTVEAEADLLLNQLIVRPGDPYDADRVARDIQNLTRLGRFATVRARVDPNPDGTVDLVYVVEEQPLLADVQVVGNKAFGDRELLEEALLRAGDPRDPFLLDQAASQIRRKYRDAGYFLADVTVDEPTLEETGILILRVREGPRVRVRGVSFRGNEAFAEAQLRGEIETRPYIVVIRPGVLSTDTLDQDMGRLRRFYEERGYLDVRVGRRVLLSDDQRDAVVEFIIDEGARYSVSRIEVHGNTAFSDEQVRRAMTLKVGDVFSIDRLRATREAVLDLYGKLGFIETDLDIRRVFHPTEPTVTLEMHIEEAPRTLVGNVLIRGNLRTRDRVVRRQVRRMSPGRPYDRTGIRETERRITETGLFREASVTVLGEPDAPVRDALIEVREGSTGSLTFGAAVSSDAGLFGAIDLTQRNFDITDTPDTFGELFTGQAFRGAGQSFSLSLQPGRIFQRYSASFREPYLFDTDYFLDTDFFFFRRAREVWDEQRFGGGVGLGRRFGDIWSASVRSRFEQVEIRDPDADAPVDVFDVEGTNFVDTIGLFVTRSTVDSRIFPTSGTRLTGGVERAGVLGDFDFTRLSAEASAFFTVDEDFFGRRTVLSFNLETGYIVEGGRSPLFERFYAGGHRTFRGFDFRGVGPRGIIGGGSRAGEVGRDPVGGDFLFLLGSEYNFPIWEEIVRGVLFVDSGTVQERAGLDEYRVSVGGGVRLLLPILGQAPLAFDLAYPLVKQDGDRTRVFSFDIALPF